MVAAASSGTAAAVTMAPGVMTITSRANIMQQPQQAQAQAQAQGSKMAAPGVLSQGQLAGNKMSQIRHGQPAPLVLGQFGKQLPLIVYVQY